MDTPEIPKPSLRARLWHRLRQLVKPVTLERRAEVQVQMRDSCHPDFDFFLLVVLSCVIATAGLLTDSAAVIIGAMLVAPLMSPIIGLGLASLTGDTRLLRDSASALGRGALLAIGISALLAWGNRYLPFVSLQELPKEVLSRTHPSPIDLTIALAGGLAAAYALAQPSISAALPGVAIATALMPPLCTVGIGVAMGSWDVAGGALLLFITNAVTIAFAAMLIVGLLGFTPRRENNRKVMGSLAVTAALTIALLVPLTIISARFVRQATENRKINLIVTGVVQNYGAELVNMEVAPDGGTVQMTITLRTAHSLSYQDVVNLQGDIALQLQQPVAIKVNQVIAAQLDPLIPPTFTPTPTLVTVIPTFTATSTATPTPTRTSTPIPPTATSTPSTARIRNTQPLGWAVDLRQRPGGPSITRLREGSYVTLLYGYEILDGLVWLEVMDDEGRLGWIPQIYLSIVTQTPTITPSKTASPKP